MFSFLLGLVRQLGCGKLGLMAEMQVYGIEVLGVCGCPSLWLSGHCGDPKFGLRSLKGAPGSLCKGMRQNFSLLLFFFHFLYFILILVNKTMFIYALYHSPENTFLCAAFPKTTEIIRLIYKRFYFFFPSAFPTKLLCKTARNFHFQNISTANCHLSVHGILYVLIM